MPNYGKKPGSSGARGSQMSHANTRKEDAITIDVRKIQIKPVEGSGLAADLFDTVAQQAARDVAGDSQNTKNKPSQIRQFYDEVVMWEEKVQRDESRFAEYLPFIRMLNAKAAYAEGRNHVDKNFVELIHHCLNQVDSPQVLRNFKLFFEAFMGFYKVEGPSG